MQDTKQSNAVGNWSSMQAYTLAAICLFAGVAGGWFIRGSQSPAATVQATNAEAATPSSAQASTASMPSPEQMKQMADTQAKPLLDQLAASPNNPAVLTEAGNVYYDAQQYPTAISFYERVLKVEPKNAGVRTDLATAYWYLGNPDKAIEEFNRALSDEPNKANTLFNLGIVKWQGKMDVQGALAAWQKLLETNPNYENKEKVLELIAQASKHAGLKPGPPGKSQSE